MEAFTESKENFEKLFLFEFLVDHVCLYNSKLNLDKQTVAVLGPVAVRFQFLNYPPIEVNEDSFTPSTKPLLEDTKTYLKSGKSCMFSLSSLKSQKVLEQSSFDVYLTVYKYKLQKYTPGQDVKVEDVFIGKTMINLGGVFKDLFNASKGTSKRLTHTKTAANKLVDNDGREVGKIVFLVRVSCFGFMVMTGFQLPSEEQKDFVYKNIEYDPVDEPPTAEKTFVEDTALSPCGGDGPCGGKRPSGGGRPSGSAKPCGQKVCTESPSGEIKAKGESKKKEKKKREKKKAEKEPEKEGPPSCPFGFPPCPCACRMMSQPSEYPQTVNGYGSGQYQGPPPSVASTQPGGPNRARDMDIDPGAVGIRGNQLVFKMPEKQAAPKEPVEGKFASSVYYKMEDEKKNGARNVIQILPKNPVECVDATKTDEKQDVLVLKLGKKRLAAGRKPKLELELRTPKMKEEKPLMEAKDTQYLESDIPKPAKSTKSSKGGKGGKGKGKKK